VDNTKSTWSIRHGGGTVGQISLLTIVPELDFGMILVTNCATGREFNPKITNLALKLYLDMDTPEPKFIDLSENELQEYVGEYEAKLTKVKVEVSKGKLTLSQKHLGGFPTEDDLPETTEPSPPLPYGFYFKDHIKGMNESNNEIIAQFIRDKEGKVSMIRSGMRLHKRV
jgi:hypothetical protein